MLEMGAPWCINEGAVCRRQGMKNRRVLSQRLVFEILAVLGITASVGLGGGCGAKKTRHPSSRGGDSGGGQAGSTRPGAARWDPDGKGASPTAPPEGDPKRRPEEEPCDVYQRCCFAYVEVLEKKTKIAKKILVKLRANCKNIGALKIETSGKQSCRIGLDALRKGLEKLRQLKGS